MIIIKNLVKKSKMCEYYGQLPSKQYAEPV